ncbi:MAG: MmgE/PrpD family protein [Chloroflexota bacterium]
MSSNTTNVSRQLAEMTATTHYNDIPEAVIIDAQRSVLDWLGSALAGALEPPARMVQRMVTTLGASAEATVFDGGRSSAAGAALVNGTATHILEYDDVHKGATLHAAAPVIPAALSVAEREGASGQDFLRAVVLGYEASLRIGEAVNPSHYRYWHPTGTSATFGAAVAAGTLLKLNPAQMLDALGSAGTQASGLWEFNADGAMSKHLHPGKAAFNGIVSADLAKLGFTGATRILEGERGFFRATTTSYDESRVTDGLGSVWKISENCYKLHSCCGHTHTAIDVTQDLRGELVEDIPIADQIAQIHIATYGPGYEIVKEMAPQTPYQAKFSIAYCVAIALLEGVVGLEQFDTQRFGTDGSSGVQDANVNALLAKTTVVVDEALSAMYPAAWPVRLTITLADGRILYGSADYPRGNPENPVETVVLADKFRSLIVPRFGAELAESGIALVERLPECEAVRPVLESFGRLT